MWRARTSSDSSAVARLGATFPARHVILARNVGRLAVAALRLGAAALDLALAARIACRTDQLRHLTDGPAGATRASDALASQTFCRMGEQTSPDLSPLMTEQPAIQLDC